MTLLPLLLGTSAGGPWANAATPSIAIDLDRDAPGIQSLAHLTPSSEPMIRGAIVVEADPLDSVGIYAIEIEIQSSSRTGALFDCEDVFTFEGGLTETPSSSGEGVCDVSIEPNRFGRRHLLVEDAVIGLSGSIQVFLFDLPISFRPGEIHSFSFRSSRIDSQLGLRINGEGRTLEAGLPSDISHLGATVVSLTGEEPSETPTPTVDLSTPTPTSSPTETPTEVFPPLSPRLVIDLDRLAMGVQSTLDWVDGEERLLRGAIEVLGPSAWSAGSYALEIRASNGQTTNTVIDCSGSDFLPGEVVDAGPSYAVATCTGRTFRRTSLFAGEAMIGGDGEVRLFEFDLSIRCSPGDILDFSFTSSDTNPLFGLELEGLNYTLGEDSARPIPALGALVYCLGPTPTPSPSPVPTLQSEGLLEIIEGIRAGTHKESDLIQKSLGWMD